MFVSEWKRMVGIEGEYSDRKSDSGGKTRYGVTESVARSHGYKGLMSELPYDLAMNIAKTEYWDVMKLDNISVLSPYIARELFDIGYNMGTYRASEFLQRCLNVFNKRQSYYPDIKVDGKIGPATLSSLTRFLKTRKSQGETVLLRALNALQGAFYIQLAEARQKDEDSVYGWILQRVNMEKAQ